MRRRLNWAVALLLGLALAVSVWRPAHADGRVALVVGNAAYGPEIGPLKNPVSDARLIATTLQDLGFTVDLVLDADQKALKRAVKSFGAKLREAGADGIGLFYYAGHGLQVGGENYLIPVGAQIAAEGDVELEAVSAGSILSQMQYAGNAVNLVFLDACRNNPLTRGFRSGERGLVRIDAPRGSFIGYSTAPGEVAEDGNGANSPYALALAAELRQPGESVDTAHRNVRARVLAATGKRQTPWDSSSLTGAVVLAALTPEPSAPDATPASPAAAAPSPNAGIGNEGLFWESIKDSRNPAMFSAYLNKYPAGDFAELAKAKLAELNTDGGALVAALTPEAQSASAAPGSPPEIEELNATYAALQSANVRAEPSTDAKIVAKLGEDDAVAVTGRVKGKDWLRVKVGEQSGFVSARLLAEAKAEEIAAWQALKKVPEPEAIRSFLKAHPNGLFNPKAEALLAALRSSGPDVEPAPATGSPITQEDLAGLSSELQPDAEVIRAFNALPGLAGIQSPNPYRMTYKVVGTGSQESETEFTRDVARLGSLQLLTETSASAGDWDGAKGAFKTVSTNKSLGAGLIALAISSQIQSSWPGGGSHDSFRSRAVSIDWAHGNLFSMNVGTEFSFQYSVVKDHVDAQGKTTSDRESLVYKYVVLEKFSCSKVYRLIPGACFRIQMTADTLDDQYPESTTEQYYAEAINFVLSPPETRANDGKDLYRTTILSFSLK